ncbi:MAG TPA: phosphoribosylanthranilate isomerase [Terriglobales bacterium]|nr:phosphoribosylanthranilate isomerase [Terriglobales bacterium]
MTWVKICGITNAEDAQASVEAGADALGFVFFDRSPRKVSVDQVRDIIRLLPPSVETVGVFVDVPVDVMVETAQKAGLKAMQLHRTDALQPKPQTAEPQKEGFMAHCVGELKMYFVLPAGGFNWESCGQRPPFGIFLDSGTQEQPGGTGKTFDWISAAPLVTKMSKEVNVVIAGGLNPHNVASAICVLHPWGVDVSSGVEERPGKKDPERVRAFIRAVREADKIA